MVALLRVTPRRLFSNAGDHKGRPYGFRPRLFLARQHATLARRSVPAPTSARRGRLGVRGSAHRRMRRRWRWRQLACGTASASSPAPARPHHPVRCHPGRRRARRSGVDAPEHRPPGATGAAVSLCRCVLARRTGGAPLGDRPRRRCAGTREPSTGLHHAPADVLSDHLGRHGERRSALPWRTGILDHGRRGLDPRCRRPRHRAGGSRGRVVRGLHRRRAAR